MAPPFTASLHTAPSLSQTHEQQPLPQQEQQLQYQKLQRPLLQQEQHMPLDQEGIVQPQPGLQHLQQLLEHKDEAKDLAIPTDITIKTDVDPHDETTTTTTIVHLPFQIAQQCPPPKVISWMKSHRAARPKHAAQHNSHHQHPHHHHHSSRHAPTNRVERLLPFLRKRKSSVDHAKKGNSAVTVFSIQVTVLGRVLVPPNSTDLFSTLDQEQPRSLKPEDLAPTKTISAQINRSETTSYVIHRTFEDFQRLSEGVLCLQRALHAHHSSHQQHQSHDDPRHHGDHILRHQQEPSTASSTESGTVLDPAASSTIAQTTAASIPPHEGPALTALRVRHPRPNLYQSFLRQFGFSTAKANQRAFDASSTTHGFHEEGAFERVLELNQYLEDVWYWLLPENVPPELDLSVVHDIMQWLKPSSLGTHADGRQMRDRLDPSQEQPRPDTSIMRRNQAQPKTVSMEPESSVSTAVSVVPNAHLPTPKASSETPRPTELLPSVSKRRPRQGTATDSTTAALKVKRRISFSHVLKSLSFNTSDTPLRSRPHHARQSFHESAAGRAKTVSASMPTSPTLKDSFGGDEIYIWSTVTTKNMVGARPTVISSPVISASSST
ncbi:hypothetical protein BGZ70_002458 [Mortierella alpina]|uniref:Uncharacterized protein n=1 Tax=Mortierella alpina TaxID=64518 RepID=A0A9P6M6K5_MORAP|nr:hypothetical protein BGZ70_002458 [Mortierella alpina]